MHENMQELKDALKNIEKFMETLVRQNETIQSQLLDSKLGVVPRGFVRLEDYVENIAIMREGFKANQRATSTAYIIGFIVALGIANIKEVAPLIGRVFSSAGSLVDSAWGAVS